ncbi:hypothetical protein GCM10009843_09180 [Nocardioides bigeumensis]|jgi:hypothetical protein|uniref:Uncharacterized protein n=1 Tax=Nocardioides bigeumensis TaxID=433657 RepID=A0ABN2XYX9_9ACTN
MALDDDVLQGNPFEDPVEFVPGSATGSLSVCTRCGATVGQSADSGRADLYQLRHADWHKKIDGR